MSSKRIVIKLLFVFLLISIILQPALLYPGTVFAGEKEPGTRCETGDSCKDAGGKKYSCQFSARDPISKKPVNTCQEVSDIGQVFGKIEPPEQLRKLLGADETGATAISNFLSRLVGLFFTLATLVALFMFLWAAIEWMTSAGEKEKVASARNKIIYTIIGIILLATSFAILNIVGVFTGFTFFAGQK